MELKELVQVHPKRCGGEPTIMNFRLPVRMIYDLMDAGYSPEEIVWLYPFLEVKIVKELASRRTDVERLIHEYKRAEKAPPRR